MILNNKDYQKHKRIVITQNAVRLCRAFLILGVLVLSIITVYNFDLKVDDHSFMENNKPVDTSAGPQCEGLSFQDTAICLNDFVREIFIYNITEDDVVLSLDDLKLRGGDCKDWTTFYESYMQYYGYDQTQRVKIFVEDEGDYSIYHVFLITSHSSGYCHMDMTDLQCYQYSNDDGEVRE